MNRLKSVFGHSLALIALAIVVETLNSSPAFATGSFMLDLEANGVTIPGGLGGKVAVASGPVTMNIFALFQGSSGVDTDYGIRAASAWVRSSTGGLLGDLSATPGGNYINTGAQSGSQIDVDGDGDKDIGSTNANIFEGVASFTTNYGLGANNGTQDGTISAAVAHSLNASAPATGDGWGYALIGTLSFTPLSPVIGQSTTVSTVDIFATLTGGNANSVEQAQDIGVGTGTTITQGRFNWNGSAGNNSAVLNGAGVVITAVPEPSSIVLAGMGVVGLLAAAISRKRNVV